LDAFLSAREWARSSENREEDTMTMHSVLLLPLAVVGAFAVKLPYGSAEEKKKRAVDAKGCHHQQVALSSESSSPQRTRIDPIGLLWERKRRRHHHLHVSCCSFYSKYRNTFDAAATNREESRGGGTESIVVAVKEEDEEEEGERLVTEEDWEKPLQDSDTQILASFLTAYNIVHVVEVSRSADHRLAGARILLLDNPANVHSVWYQHKVLTNSYYDEFATLMPLLPDGPVGIYGVGAGATAHIIQHFWPAVTMHGWELDPDIITVARQFFNLDQLEVEPEKRASASEDAVLYGFECNHAEDSPVIEAREKEDGNASVKPASTEGDNDHVAVNARTETQPGRKSGKLFVYIGDALASDATVEGGFAGLIVDLFAHGAVIPPLMLPETWEQLKSRLRPEGDQILELVRFL
jgi:hypothetical protein